MAGGIPFFKAFAHFTEGCRSLLGKKRHRKDEASQDGSQPTEGPPLSRARVELPAAGQRQAAPPTAYSVPFRPFPPSGPQRAPASEELRPAPTVPAAPAAAVQLDALFGKPPLFVEQAGGRDQTCPSAPASAVRPAQALLQSSRPGSAPYGAPQRHGPAAGHSRPAAPQHAGRTDPSANGSGVHPVGAAAAGAGPFRGAAAPGGVPVQQNAHAMLPLRAQLPLPRPQPQQQEPRAPRLHQLQPQDCQQPQQPPQSYLKKQEQSFFDVVLQPHRAAPPVPGATRRSGQVPDQGQSRQAYDMQLHSQRLAEAAAPAPAARLRQELAYHRDTPVVERTDGQAAARAQRVAAAGRQMQCRRSAAPGVSAAAVAIGVFSMDDSLATAAALVREREGLDAQHVAAYAQAKDSARIKALAASRAAAPPPPPPPVVTAQRPALAPPPPSTGRARQPPPSAAPPPLAAPARRIASPVVKDDHAMNLLSDAADPDAPPEPDYAAAGEDSEAYDGEEEVADEERALSAGELEEAAAVAEADVPKTCMWPAQLRRSSEEDDTAWARMLTAGTLEKALVTHPLSGNTITGAKMLCMRIGVWLNDEVINLYMLLLLDRDKRWRAPDDDRVLPKCHFWNSFFLNKLYKDDRVYNYASVKRWTTKRRLEKSAQVSECILDVDRVIMPVHLGCHWTCAMVDLQHRAFYYLDSMGHKDHDCLDALARWVVDEAMDKKGEAWDVSSWPKYYPTHIPQQNNGCDCGVFAITYASYLGAARTMDWTQRHMGFFRKRVTAELLAAHVE